MVGVSKSPLVVCAEMFEVCVICPILARFLTALLIFQHKKVRYEHQRDGALKVWEEANTRLEIDFDSNLSIRYILFSSYPLARYYL
jgi:hypothetical protein